MRLQKYLAHKGIASRRKCEEYILSGRVVVNNQVINELGYKIDPEIDNVYFDKKLVNEDINKVYIMLNKPKGYVSSVSDPHKRKTVIDLINIQHRIYPIGRLDFDTEGLLLLTNDGEITYKLTHPKHNINKVYNALIKGIPNQSDLDNFSKGLKIEDYITSPCKINILEKNSGNAYVQITIHEGKKRQIRKMCKKIGHPVINLKRVAIGKLTLNNLEIGQWRYLTDEEIKYLQRCKGDVYDRS